MYIAENLGLFATKIKVIFHTTMVILQDIWANLSPKWKESIFSILQSRHCIKFGHISQQNIRSIDSSIDYSDTAENLGTYATKK